VRIENYTDWKRSKLYTDYVVERNNPHLVFDHTMNLFRLDEIDYILNMISKKKLNDEINKLYEPNIRKGLFTCEFLLKELIGDTQFSDEYDPLAIENGGT
jgi:hypothetical protein